MRTPKKLAASIPKKPSVKKAVVTPAAKAGEKTEAQEKAANLTHADLTRLGLRHLRTQGYTAFRECGANTGTEIADVIGWTHTGFSVLLECKTSRADFLRDKLKAFRKFADLGYGNYRFFVCPAGLIQANEVPENWGLIWAYENRVRRVKESKRFDFAAVAVVEKKLLAACLYRMNVDVRTLCEENKLPLPSRYRD